MSKKFTAVLVEIEFALGWRIVDVPFDVEKAFGIAGRVPVKGTVNGFAFQSSLFPRKGDLHFLMLNKHMQKGAGVREVGDVVEVSIELDTSERTVDAPEPLQWLLDEEPEIEEFYRTFNYSTRKWIADWILQPKSAEAQNRRAEQIAVRLMQIRDGEEEAPPILQAIFAHNPKARKGWELLPPSRKRGHLFGIFTSQNPETRQRRAEKAVEMMVEYAEKAAKKK